MNANVALFFLVTFLAVAGCMALFRLLGGKVASQTKAEPRGWTRRLVFTIAAAAMILAVGALVVIPRAVGSSQAVVSHEILVRCLPMRVAQDIAQTLLVSPGNEVEMSPGSRVLRVRATATQMSTLQLMFESTAKAQTSCDNTPAR